MRELGPPPASVLDPATLLPLTGSYRGPLPPVDLAPLGKSALYRLTHRKRWMYVAIASPELYVGLALVHLGYLMTAFVFVFDRTTGSVVVDRSSLGPTLLGKVSGTSGEGCHASFRLGGTDLRIVRRQGDDGYFVEAHVADLELEARFDTKGAPPPISVIANVPGGVVNTTEKRSLLPVTGEAKIAGRRTSLDGALGGLDYTHGYLARHTAWRWAFALGNASCGARVGLNLVEGFVGEPECAVWIDDELYPLGEGRFTFDAKDPMRPWRVGTADGAVELEFTPAGMHHEQKNLVVVASRFIQPVGTFSGRLRTASGRELVLDRVLGVTEDQDVLW